MNNRLFDQLSAEEQPVASQLVAIAEDMQISPAFQQELRARLMETHQTKARSVPAWRIRIVSSLGWAILVLCAAFILNWMIRSLVPDQAATAPRPEMQASFERSVRAGMICTGPLAAGHGFAVSLTNQDKSGLVMLDQEKHIGELRSFAWSPDGTKLAVLGNTTGHGNIYLTDPSGARLQPVLSNSGLGYLWYFAWAGDGSRLLMWSPQTQSSVFMVNADGTGLEEIRLDMQSMMNPQFSASDERIVFYGATASASGLFEVSLDGSPSRLISPLVEDESGFALAPDGSGRAYMEMDRSLGEARLVMQGNTTGSKSILGTLAIPSGSGSSLPESANLSWSQDGRLLVFEFGRSATDRAVYLARTDGSGMVKLADSAHAPAISADGKCLAYISDNKVFLLDLTGAPSSPGAATPLFLTALPAGRSPAPVLLDKLQWRPGIPPEAAGP